MKIAIHSEIVVDDEFATENIERIKNTYPDAEVSIWGVGSIVGAREEEHRLESEEYTPRRFLVRVTEK